MSILLSLSPFAVFFALMRLVSPIAGLVGALVVSVLLCCAWARRRESVKILEIGSVVLFGGLVAYTLAAAPQWTVATVRLAVDGGLLAIVLVSLAIGRPFTLQYARERVPEPIWALPVFFTTNRADHHRLGAGLRGTRGGGCRGGVRARGPAVARRSPCRSRPSSGAVWFTRWYPAAVQRRFANAAAS